MYEAQMSGTSSTLIIMAGAFMHAVRAAYQQARGHWQQVQVQRAHHACRIFAALSVCGKKLVHLGWRVGLADWQVLHHIQVGSAAGERQEGLGAALASVAGARHGAHGQLDLPHNQSRSESA